MYCNIKESSPQYLFTNYFGRHINWPQTVICQLASLNEQHADHRQITRIQKSFLHISDQYIQQFTMLMQGRIKKLWKAKTA